MTSTIKQLIDDNLAILRQGLDLVAALDDRKFTENAPALALSGVGPHLRHVVDFYTRLLTAVESKTLGTDSIPDVDYDARDRDPRIETDPAYATAIVQAIVGRLQRASNSGLVADDQPLRVRSDGSPWVMSTVSRELQSLVSHTVHHYALIAVAVRSGGGQPDSEFGVAPSTIRHWARTKAKEQAAAVDEAKAASNQGDPACAR